MQRNIEFSEGEYYHIYNRGVEKRDIFLNNVDRDRFIALLYACNGTKPVNIREFTRNKRQLSEIYLENCGEKLVAIGIYCLMPNHFHVLVKEIVESGISKFMLKFSTAYTMYFNTKYDRTGGLFGGPFKAKHVDNDNYLRYLYAYIHLNPVKLIEPAWKKEGIKDLRKAKMYLKKYEYSSHLDYLGHKRAVASVILMEEFPKYFDQDYGFEDIVEDWLTYKKYYALPRVTLGEVVHMNI